MYNTIKKYKYKEPKYKDKIIKPDESKYRIKKENKVGKNVNNVDENRQRFYEYTQIAYNVINDFYYQQLSNDYTIDEYNEDEDALTRTYFKIRRCLDMRRWGMMQIDYLLRDTHDKVRSAILLVILAAQYAVHIDIYYGRNRNNITTVIDNYYRQINRNFPNLHLVNVSNQLSMDDRHFINVYNNVLVDCERNAALINEEKEIEEQKIRRQQTILPIIRTTDEEKETSRQATIREANERQARLQNIPIENPNRRITRAYQRTLNQANRNRICNNQADPLTGEDFESEEALVFDNECYLRSSLIRAMESNHPTAEIYKFFYTWIDQRGYNAINRLPANSIIRLREDNITHELSNRFNRKIETI